MKSIFTVLILIVPMVGKGQFGKGTKEISSLWKDKTLVIVQYPGYNVYNQSAKKIATKRWYNSDIKYINFSDIKNSKRKTEEIYLDVHGQMIAITNSTMSSIDFKKDGWAYNYIQQDFKRDWEEWTKKFNKDVNNCFYKHRSNPYMIFLAKSLEKIENSSAERTELLLDILFNTVDNFSKGDYEYWDPKKDNDFYNTKENKEVLKNKTLIIDEKCLPTDKKNPELLEIDNLKSNYRGNIKIVSEEELKSIIASNDKNYAFLHVIMDGSFPTFSIIDISQRKIIYTGQERTKMGDTSFAKIFIRALNGISNDVFE